MVLQRDAQGVTRIDAIAASEDVIDLLGADRGEYVATEKELWVRATPQMLRAGAAESLWAPVPPKDDILSRISSKAYDPFSMLFGQGSYFAALSNADGTTWSDGKLVAGSGDTAITVTARGGQIVRVEDSKLVATITPLQEKLSVPEQSGNGEEISRLFGKIAQERNVAAVAGIAVSLHKAAIGFQAMEQSRSSGEAPDMARISSRNLGALLSAVTPPPGKAPNRDLVVFVSSGRRAELLQPAARPAPLVPPVWMQVQNPVGSACVRLGLDRGALGVAKDNAYALGRLVAPDALGEDPAAWALVAVAAPGEPACRLVPESGTGW